MELSELLEIPRKLVSMGATEEAQKAYTLAVTADGYNTPELMMEAAMYILSSGGEYRLAYKLFIYLYNHGNYREDVFEILQNAFYLPNIKKLEKKYNKNVKLLKKYPYIFTESFPAFADLHMQFFPYDDNGFIPYSTETELFGEYINVNDDGDNRYFFENPDKALFCEDVYSQYQLEYLCDNVRRSEWAAMENHIYLFYSSPEMFYAYLSILDFGNLLPNKQLVFLLGEGERSMYPIDFKEKYGIDYESMTVKPLSVSEVKKLVLVNQLMAHNGLDFFCEILDDHPNILWMGIIMHYNLIDTMNGFLDNYEEKIITQEYLEVEKDGKKIQIGIHMLRRLLGTKAPTKHDAFIALAIAIAMAYNQPSADMTGKRIVPAVMLSPHFHNIQFSVIDNRYAISQSCPQYDDMRRDKCISDFKYIRTLSPMRRKTTSVGATLRFGCKEFAKLEDYSQPIDGELKFGIILHLADHLLARGFYADPKDKIWRHSCAVRLEDGKLNPKATFTELAKFLDVPYTSSMTYCSVNGEHNATDETTNTERGFELGAVYRKYEEYLSDEDKYAIELVTAEETAMYGYKPQYYDGKSFTEEEIIELLKKPKRFYKAQSDVIKKYKFGVDGEQMSVLKNGKVTEITGKPENFIDEIPLLFPSYYRDLEEAVHIRHSQKYFINKHGDALTPIKWLKPNEELLETPLYE